MLRRSARASAPKRFQWAESEVTAFSPPGSSSEPPRSFRGSHTGTLLISRLPWGGEACRLCQTCVSHSASGPLSGAGLEEPGPRLRSPPSAVWPGGPVWPLLGRPVLAPPRRREPSWEAARCGHLFLYFTLTGI